MTTRGPSGEIVAQPHFELSASVTADRAAQNMAL